MGDLMRLGTGSGLQDPYAALIDSMAKALVTEYLAPKATPAAGDTAPRTYPVPLPATDKAA